MNRYRLYIDESGDHKYGKLEAVPDRYLCLFGVIIKTHYNDKVVYPQLEQLKRTHFHYDPDEPVILHRRDILGKSGPFVVLKESDKEAAFNEDILNFYTDKHYHIIAVVIDKKNHLSKYGQAAHHPYHYCLNVLLERYCGFLNLYNAKGDVLVEGRGRKENQLLQDEYKDLLSRGTRYHSGGFFQETLTSKKLKFKDKEHNIAGLQLADLLAIPAKQNILEAKEVIAPKKDSFTYKIMQSIESKYNHQVYNGKIWGYGKIFLG